jgi:hypothetical protein
MPPFSSALDRISVAVPCEAPWAAMRGNDRVRFCPRCKKHVYNLSGMTRYEAEYVIRQKEGGICARYYRRTDGTVITEDCLALAATRRWAVLGLGLAGTLIAGLFAALFTAPTDSAGRTSPFWAHEVEPFRTFLEWIEPTPTQRTLSIPGGSSGTMVTMGKMCPPAPEQPDKE